MDIIATGLDHLREEKWKKLTGYRLGLVANQASVDKGLTPAKEVISRVLPGQLKALFGPQHGFGGENQDNMVETNHSYDDRLGIPVFSLYSHTRIPTPEMLDLIDVLIIDLADVGTRVYTFASTMINCLKIAAAEGKKVFILDRPNPLGGIAVEGNLLSPKLYSFVGPYSLPIRHGLTMGEMALIFNDVFALGCDLEIIPMIGWHRDMLWHETGLRWIMPSPNMPLPETAFVYPGQVLWEGTNVSEGRGTCRPFEIFGAPYLDTRAIKQVLEPEARRGCHLQDYSFRPTFQKWAGEICHGFMIHIVDPHVYHPYFTSISLLKAVLEIHSENFKWKNPPYEYDYERMPIDLISGNLSLRKDLESGMPVKHIREKWAEDLTSFALWKQAYHIYDA